MMTTSKQRGKTYLNVGTKQIERIKGAFFVPYSLLIGEDLSTLPVGTVIVIDYGRKFGRTPKQLIMIDVLEVLDHGALRVGANHYRCQCCWKHALDHGKYLLIAEKIFRNSSSHTTAFRYEGAMPGDDDSTYQVFSLEVANGLYKDIEKRAFDIVIPMLQPLIDYRDQLDAQTLQQFGI